MLAAAVLAVLGRVRRTEAKRAFFFIFCHVISAEKGCRGVYYLEHQSAVLPPQNWVRLLTRIIRTCCVNTQSEYYAGLMELVVHIHYSYSYYTVFVFIAIITIVICDIIIM